MGERKVLNVSFWHQKELNCLVQDTILCLAQWLHVCRPPIEILPSWLWYYQIAQAARRSARPIRHTYHGSFHHEVGPDSQNTYIFIHPLTPPHPHTHTHTHIHRCLTCGNYVYKGKKFNSRKEDAKGEKYLGIQIYRFYIRCPECLSEITFKVWPCYSIGTVWHYHHLLQTDPQNADYVPEHGAVRTFQVTSSIIAHDSSHELFI